jgi:hypothetical protein
MIWWSLYESLPKQESVRAQITNLNSFNHSPPPQKIHFDHSNFSESQKLFQWSHYRWTRWIDVIFAILDSSFRIFRLLMIWWTRFESLPKQENVRTHRINEIPPSIVLTLKKSIFISQLFLKQSNFFYEWHPSNNKNNNKTKTKQNKSVIFDLGHYTMNFDLLFLADSFFL